MAVVKNQPTPISNNIDLSVTQRQRFSINNDPDKVIWLNISDVGIVARVKEYYPKLMESVSKVHTIISESDTESADGLNNLVEALKTADTEMREFMDKIFDANVSEVCAPEGTMYDLFDGDFRFEIILEALLKLYTINMDNEMAALKKKADKYTKKYRK